MGHTRVLAAAVLCVLCTVAAVPVSLQPSPSRAEVAGASLHDSSAQAEMSALEMESEIERHGTRRRHSHRSRHHSSSHDCAHNFGLVKVKRTNGKIRYFYEQACERVVADNTVAWGVFDDAIMTTGWADLTIRTSGKHSDLEQAFAAGYLEGALTAERIWQLSRVITANHKGKTGVHEYFREQDAFVRSKIADVNATSTDRKQGYWYNVALVIAQMDGLLEGYNAHCGGQNKQLSKWDVWLMQSDGDILDVERIPQTSMGGFPVHKKARDMTRMELIELVSLRGRCSALIKFVPGDDLYFAHTTWDDYTEMLRIYKHYEFNFRHAAVKSGKSSHSSYAGLISSSDDFYLLDSGLVVIETTLNILDETLYDLCKPGAQVLAWIRNLVANRMATTAPEWIDIISEYNSGTYNDQWMVIDLNLYDRSLQQLKPNTVWIAEQIPGYVDKEDVSHIINKDRYWASYNRPYFQEVSRRSMYNHYSSVHGEMFSYHQCPRARIFQRDQVHVKDVETMKKLMMQNKWQTDPYSQGCPGNAIASRFDIPAPNCPMRQVANGATDAKVSNSRWAKHFMSVTIGGPTHDDQKPFRWDDPMFASQDHDGQPVVWDFDWQVMKPAKL